MYSIDIWSTAAPVNCTRRTQSVRRLLSHYEARRDTVERRVLAAGMLQSDILMWKLILWWVFYTSHATNARFILYTFYFTRTYGTSLCIRLCLLHHSRRPVITGFQTQLWPVVASPRFNFILNLYTKDVTGDLFVRLYLKIIVLYKIVLSFDKTELHVVKRKGFIVKYYIFIRNILVDIIWFR